MRRLAALVVFLLAAAPATLAQPALLSPSAIPESGLTGRQAAFLRVLRAEPGVGAVQIVVADAALLGWAAAVAVALPDGPAVVVDATGSTAERLGGRTWAGRRGGALGASAVLVARDGSVTGSVRDGDAVYTIRPLSGGLHAIARVDTRGLRDHGDDYPAFERQQHERVEQERAGLERRAAPDAGRAGASLPASTVDVLVVYTAEVAAAYADPVAFAQLAITSANQTYANSGMATRIALSSAYQTPTAAAATMGTDLPALANPSDGRFDEAHTTRNAVGADLVAMLGPSSYTDGCGLGYLNSSATSAFTVTAYTCAVGNYSFAHEIGHNFGADHDPYVTPAPIYAYGRGSVDLAGQWRTVMAYNDQCAAGSFTCTRVAYWSDPDVTYTDTVAPVHSGPTGDAATRDNARVIEERAATLAAFRVGGPPPALAASPGALSATRAPGQTTARTLTIQNTAAADSRPLTWSLAIDGQSGAARAAGSPSDETTGDPLLVSARPFVPTAAAPPTTPAVDAARAVDCTNNQITDQLVATNLFATASGGTEYGQSVTAPCTGRLQMVTFLVDYDSAPNAAWSAALRIYQGAGTGGTPLFGSTFSWTNGPSGATYLTLTLPSPIVMTGGQVYTWFLDMTSGTSGTRININNPVAGGTLYTTSNGAPGSATPVAGTDGLYEWLFLAPTTPSVPWISLGATSGSVAGGAAQNVAVTFNATGLTEGTYTASLVLTTNDPATPTTTVPLTLTVGGAGVVAGAAGWRLLAAPAAGMTVDDLAALNLVQGVPGYYPTAAANLYTGYSGTAYTTSAGTGTVLAPGRGFWWQFYNVNLTPGGPSNSFALPTTLTTANAAVTTNTPVTLHAAGDRFNLLGNPFGTSLTVSGVSAWPGAGNLASTVVQMWNAAGSTYESSVTRPVIAPWQGFWAEGLTAGTLTIPASARTTGGTLTRPGSDAPEALVAFELASADGALVDRAAVLTLGEGRLDGRDAGDAAKLAPLAAAHVLLAFATTGDDGTPSMRAVESRPLAALSVPLSVASVGAGSALVLTWPRVEGLPEGWAAVLRDLSTGTTVDLAQAASYAFSVVPTAARPEASVPSGARAAVVASRFELTVGPRGATAGEGGASGALSLASPRPNPSRGASAVAFSVPEAGAVRLSVVDLLGREVSVLVDGARAAGGHVATVETSRLAPGVYVVRLAAGREALTRRLVVVR